MGNVNNKLLTSQLTSSTMASNLFNFTYIFLISKQQKVKWYLMEFVVPITPVSYASA